MDALILSCEHGGNRIPRELAPHFASLAAKKALASHQGYDLGALEVARTLARHFRVPLIYSTVSRLVVDLNRTLRHPKLFSELVRDLPPGARARIIDRYYTPHRARVDGSIRAALDDGMRVVHVGVHSFTPVLAGEVRNADASFLYDPSRLAEKDLCARWRSALCARVPGLRVRRNYPYRGTDDGLTTHLRRSFPVRRYLGIELEINQAVLGDARARPRVTRAVVDSLAEVFPG